MVPTECLSLRPVVDTPKRVRKTKWQRKASLELDQMKEINEWSSFNTHTFEWIEETHANRQRSCSTYFVDDNSHPSSQRIPPTIVEYKFDYTLTPKSEFGFY